MDSSELLYWYWLQSVKNIGPARIRALIDSLGTPELIFGASLEDYLRVPGIGKDLALAIDTSKAQLQASKDRQEQEALLVEHLKVSLLTLLDPRYPAMLKHEATVAPALLYVRGSLASLSQQTVAIIGTRHPSLEGTRSAHDFAKQMVSAEWQIISGLALGIDAAGHQGALDAGGYTVAVLGCGVDRIYPPENKRLFEAILEQGGAIISEYPFGTPPKGDNLRKRNKITVGLTRAVVVAECPIGSGTLIAAHEAVEQVKPVFAFSFSDSRKSSQGSQQLLSDGDAQAISIGTNSDQLNRKIEAYDNVKVAVLLDLDGVLGDVSRLTRLALNYAVKEIDGKKPDPERVNRTLHLSPRAALARLSGSDTDALFRAFDRYWHQKYSADLVPHPQLKTTLEKLRTLGMPLGVVTSRNRDHATSALSALKMRDMFQNVTTWGNTTQHKPDASPILHALKNLPRHETALYVGDRPQDIAAARSAGIFAVGATWFLSEESGGETLLKEAKPDYIVDQPSKLFELVLRLKRQKWSKQ